MCLFYETKKKLIDILECYQIMELFFEECQEVFFFFQIF